MLYVEYAKSEKFKDNGQLKKCFHDPQNVFLVLHGGFKENRKYIILYCYEFYEKFLIFCFANCVVMTVAFCEFFVRSKVYCKFHSEYFYFTSNIHYHLLSNEFFLSETNLKRIFCILHVIKNLVSSTSECSTRQILIS